MAILQVKNVTLRFGVETILEGVDFLLEAGDKLGIIGVNGCGKSSLFRVITGEYTPDTGSVTVPAGRSVGMLSQDGAFAVTTDEGGESTTVLDWMLQTKPEILRMQERLAELERQLSLPDTPHLSAVTAEYSALHERYLAEGGLEHRGRCASLLSSLGFDEKAQHQPLSTLSGGQRTRLALAQQLSREPDVLMLDEPTNHLDIATVAWLEQFLADYKKTVLVISHDRYFLDRVTNKTLCIENRRAKLYDGGYTKSAEQRRIDRALAEKHYREQQKEIARQEAYIAQQRQWNRERNIIAAESRQKLLDKMVKLEKPQNAPRPVHMRFTMSVASGNDVLRVRDLSMAFGDRALFSHLNFLIKKGQRVLLIGPNGCGKSTLLKLILDRLSPTGGVVEAGYNVQVGYYDQQNQNLTDENSVLEELWSAYPQLPETQIRNTLASFRFVGEDVLKPVSVLSGGERARLTLSKLILSRMNLLVLDEPTNHLDIDSREALEMALEAYDGTILVVSHDRYLIDKLATRILELSPGDAFEGDLLDFEITRQGHGYEELLTYKAARMAERSAKAPTAADAPSATMSRAKADYLQSKQAAAAERKRRSRIERAQAECGRLEAELERIEREMNGDAARDYTRLAALDVQRQEAEDALMALYEELEQLQSAAPTSDNQV